MQSERGREGRKDMNMIMMMVIVAVMVMAGKERFGHPRA